MANLAKRLRLYGSAVEDLADGELLQVVRGRAGVVDWFLVVGTSFVVWRTMSFEMAAGVAILLAVVTQLARLSRRLDAVARLLEQMRPSDASADVRSTTS